MARHRKYETQPEADPALDISSLIDVCFLLLIYFIVTSTITPRESDLAMALPGNESEATKTDIEPMLISVEANGVISTGVGAAKQVMDTNVASRTLSLLRSHLLIYKNAATASGTKPLVQIYVHDDATQQRVIDVLNALAEVQISTVTFTDLPND
jgi:biopolymer transport protein ExbD